MKLIFLGTGGGRFATLHQVRSTGGLLLDMHSYLVSIDPGPSALSMMKKLHINPQHILGLLVSHAHPDHYSNAEMIIEGITHGGRSKRGFLVGSESVIHGIGENGPAISPYYQKRLESVYVAKPGNAFYPTPELEIWFTMMAHSDPTTVGFKIVTPDGVIGYIADTAYIPSISEAYKGTDILILPITRPMGMEISYHLSTDTAAKIIKAVKPKLALINHMGIKMIRAGPEKEARLLSNMSGKRTIALKDGDMIELRSGRYTVLN